MSAPGPKCLARQAGLTQPPLPSRLSVREYTAYALNMPSFLMKKSEAKLPSPSKTAFSISPAQPSIRKPQRTDPTANGPLTAFDILLRTVLSHVSAHTSHRPLSSLPHLALVSPGSSDGKRRLLRVPTDKAPRPWLRESSTFPVTALGLARLPALTSSFLSSPHASPTPTQPPLLSPECPGPPGENLQPLEDSFVWIRSGFLAHRATVRVVGVLERGLALRMVACSPWPPHLSSRHSHTSCECL